MSQQICKLINQICKLPSTCRQSIGDWEILIIPSKRQGFSIVQGLVVMDWWSTKWSMTVKIPRVNLHNQGVFTLDNLPRHECYQFQFVSSLQSTSAAASTHNFLPAYWHLVLSQQKQISWNPHLDKGKGSLTTSQNNLLPPQLSLVAIRQTLQSTL